MKVTLDKILLCIIAVLVLILIIGTTIGLTNKRNQKPEVLISMGKAINLAEPANTDQIVYHNLGTIRIVTAADPSVKNDTGSAMVITPWIAYPEGDTVFFEELSRKNGVIKGVFSKFFTENTQKQILSYGEEKIKSQLLEQINSYLSLGKLSDIYFTDFLFL